MSANLAAQSVTRLVVFTRLGSRSILQVTHVMNVTRIAVRLSSIALVRETFRRDILPPLVPGQDLGGKQHLRRPRCLSASRDRRADPAVLRRLARQGTPPAAVHGNDVRERGFQADPRRRWPRRSRVHKMTTVGSLSRIHGLDALRGAAALSAVFNPGSTSTTTCRRSRTWITAPCPR